ncbi:MAG: hypothetical protein GXO26_07225 [Crenarchaeota archaeon]|nr:hypothetical protein [Thermoproteota archaeon]
MYASRIPELEELLVRLDRLYSEAVAFGREDIRVELEKIYRNIMEYIEDIIRESSKLFSGSAENLVREFKDKIRTFRGYLDKVEARLPSGLLTLVKDLKKSIESTVRKIENKYSDLEMKITMLERQGKEALRRGDKDVAQYIALQVGDLQEVLKELKDLLHFYKSLETLLKAAEQKLSIMIDIALIQSEIRVGKVKIEEIMREFNVVREFTRDILGITSEIDMALSSTLLSPEARAHLAEVTERSKKILEKWSKELSIERVEQREKETVEEKV